MGTYHSNKVILPKEVYLKYFHIDEDEDDAYNLDKLKKPDDSEYDFWIYGYGNNQMIMFEDYGDTVELYFDKRNYFPIRAILNLFEFCPDNRIKWYCCDEEMNYVSRFSWDDKANEVQEEVFYLGTNLDFLRLESDSEFQNSTKYENDPEYNAYKFAWYFHPEKRIGWQKVDSENLFERYEEGPNLSTLKWIITQKQIPWQEFRSRKDGSDNLKLAIEVWPDYLWDEFEILSEFFAEINNETTDNDDGWLMTSWKIGKGPEEKRRAVLLRSEFIKLWEHMEEFLSDKMKQAETLRFRNPTLEFCFIPNKKIIKLRVHTLANSDLNVLLKPQKVFKEILEEFVFDDDNLRQLSDYFKEIRETIYFYYEEDLDELM